MSQPLTSRERIQRMFEHRDADRAPIVDLPWDSTIARWRREGLPAGADWAEYLDVDCVRHILPDNSPRYPVRLIEATAEYRVYTTPWGATRKDYYDSSGAIGYLDYSVKDRAAWAQAKERMRPSRDRIP
jgi:uroporphyrinogen decarboxylase